MTTETKGAVDTATEETKGAVDTATEETKGTEQEVSTEKAPQINSEELERFKTENAQLKDQLSELKTEVDNFAKLKQELVDGRDKAKEKLRTLEQSIKSEKVDKAVVDALTVAGAISTATAMKLVSKANIEFDKDGNLNTESVAEAVKALKESDPILFKEEEKTEEEETQQEEAPTKTGPSVKRPGESGEFESAYEKELRSAKTQKELNAVLKKYGKI